MPFNIYWFYRKLQPRFRAGRMRLFVQTFKPAETERILDIGGNAYDWADAEAIRSQMTILNLASTDSSPELPPRFTYAQGDGRCLAYPDQSFDIVYANSVIEHLGTYEDQKRFAAEALRVGRQIYIQTPNRWFPIEPHFLTLFVHFLPMSLRRRLMPFCSVRGLLRRGDNVEMQQLLDELRLLSYAEMRELFPGCLIHREKLLFMTKSFIAIRTGKVAEASRL